METRIELAQPSHLPEILALLDECDLPEEGLACRPGTLILAARAGESLVGCAALEVYGEHALLRSVAVTAEHRGEGLGDLIVEAALELACWLRVVEVYLLTDTAEGFFAQHSFMPVDRSRVPRAVAGSPGFTTCRCVDATCMARRLGTRRERHSPAALALSLHDLAPTDRLESARYACE
ncbi:MAG: GNAT family N-acetyltransferase [Gemmatimonadales bacterium]